MPARQDGQGLWFLCTPDGEDAARKIDLASWPGAEQLRRDLMPALSTMSDADGAWRRWTTIKEAHRWVRVFLSWCSENDINALADLVEERYDAFDAAMEARYSERSLGNIRAHVRPLLRASEGLPQATVWAVQRRVGSRRQDASRDYFTVREVRALEVNALRVLSRARRRVQRNYARLQQARRSVEPTKADEVLIDIFEGRHVDYQRRKRHLGVPEPATGRSLTSDHFFMLTHEEALAAGVLLACRTGWNLSVIKDLRTGSWASLPSDDEGVATVAIDKPRRRGLRHSMNVLVDNGPRSQGSAWRMVIEATQPTRAHLAALGIPSDAVMVYSGSGPTGSDRNLHGLVRQGFRARSSDRTPTWVPPGLTIDFPKIRRTFQTLIDRSPSQNTFRTHVQNYLALSPEVQREVAATVAAGELALLQRAEESVALRLQSEASVAPEIRAGRLDTATVACKDIDHHPVTGQPCVANFLACLMCRNAVATPRHLPRLVTLHQAFEDRRSAMTESAWLRWRDDYLRLTAFLFVIARLNDVSYQRHLQAATATDRQNVRDLLGGGLDV